MPGPLTPVFICPQSSRLSTKTKRREVVVVVLAGGGAGEVQSFHLIPHFRLRRAADRMAFGHVIVVVVVGVVRAVGAGGRQQRRAQKITRYLKR